MDSPSGPPAWIIGKRRAWSDCHGDLETRFSRDELLTGSMLYWTTGTFGPSFRTYYDHPTIPPRPLMTVPADVTLTVEDLGYPQELAERSYTDIRHWQDPPSADTSCLWKNPNCHRTTTSRSFRTGWPDGT
jgi:hypothetical protein